MVALLKNIPIVNEDWVKECINKKKFIKNYEDYIPSTIQNFEETFGTDFESCLEDRQKIKDLEIFAGKWENKKINVILNHRCTPASIFLILY